MNYNPGDLPFCLDKTHRATLTDQLVDGIRKAVADGTLKEGDHLPSREALAEHFDVSLRVPREAFRRLKTEGVIIPRPRLGCVVARPTGSRQWKGTVLYVRYEVDSVSYAGSSVESEVRRQMEAAGYLVLVVGIRQKTASSFDFSAVERCLGFNVALVIVGCTNPVIRRWFSRCHVPHVIPGGVRGENGCVGVVASGASRKAHEAFVAHCVMRGIRNVLQVNFSCPGMLNLKSLLTNRGIRCDIWTIPPLRGFPRIDGIVRAATRAFLQRFKREGRSWLPDLILFTDDYVASGALAAFSAYGIRAPEDVRIATLVNEGCRIPYARRLTAFVNDPKKSALRIVRPALAYLNRTEASPSVVPGLSYERGETFP